MRPSYSFADRAEAGRLLGQRVADLRLRAPVVLALPRGGVPVAAEVAWALHAPMDLVLVRKIGAPAQPELALAAVAEGDPPQLVMDAPVQAEADVSPEWLKQAMDDQLREMARRRERYLRGRARLRLPGHEAILVDDGIATGTTMRAAVAAIRKLGPARILIAVPVASPSALALLRDEVDVTVSLLQPPWLSAIGEFYDDFHQLRDEEVIALIDGVQASGEAPRP